MPAIVGDILERPSGSGPAAAPTPPTQSSAGFPQVQHRSHVSAFKRARAQATRPGGGSASDAPAVQIASSSPPSPGSGPSRMAHRPAAPPPRVPSATGNGQSAEQILQQVQAENSARVSGMSEQERQTELGELEEMFGRDLLERLRLRREKHEFARETNVVDEQTAPAAWSTGTTRDRDVDGATREQAGPSLNGASKKGDATVRFAPSGSSGPAHVSENPLSPQAIHDRYFPEEAAQRPELDWLQAASTDGGSSSAVRFDLAGNVLSSADISSIGGDRGLHHHGDEPDSAGYTIGDILHLCTSTFTPQRTLMLSLLGKIIRRCEDYEVVVLRRIQRDKIEDAALRLGLSVVCSNERNIGVLREGIACLAASTTSGESDQPDRTARIAKLPLDALMPRLDKLLEDSVAASALDASSLRQLLSVVRVIAVHSAGHAAAVTTIVPTLAESFLAGCTWPAILDKAAGDELATAHVTLDVLDICVRWERENAQVLLKRGTLELLSRFIAVQPWLWTSRQDMLDQALPCTTLALGITESLNRYGLYGSAVQMFSEALHGIGRWVAELPVVDAGPIALDLGIAYFKLLRTWYICARDAHCMVVEHDLTWSQVNGMPWAEEALDVIEKTVRMESGAESNRVAMLIAAAAEVMAARLQGLQANRIVGWEKQRMETAAALQRSGVLDVVEELLSHAHMLREVSAELLAAMCRLLDETKLLASVLERASPDVDKLLQGAKPGTPFGLIKGHLAAVLLALADKSDVSKWAGRALAILSLLQPGDEALAMLLIDDLLDLAWPREELERAGHQHGLYILRPFLHYHVLPNLDRIVGPTYAEPKYLKRTTTLRTFVEPAQPPLSQLDEERKSSLGLPLQPDWLLRPLQELAIRTSSAAFTQLPPAWDASDLQLARGSLLFVKLLRDDASDLGGLRMGGPATMLAVMKTFLLEIRPKDYDEETETFAAREEIFRDESMDGILTDLVAPYLGPHLARNGATTSAQSATIMVPGLASAAAFYQLYEAYIELYESVSFGHKLFGQLLLPPLSMRYPADYRRLFWVDHAANLLRPLGGNVFGFADVPLERGSYAVFFEPAEDDEAVLRGYVGAIVTGMVAPARGQFLFCLAGWHVAHFLWHGPSTPQQVKARTGAIKAIFGPSSRVSEAVKEWLLSVPAKVADSGLLSAPLDSGWAVTEATLQERRAVVETYLGRGPEATIEVRRRSSARLNQTPTGWVPLPVCSRASPHPFSNKQSICPYPDLAVSASGHVLRRGKRVGAAYAAVNSGQESVHATRQHQPVHLTPTGPAFHSGASPRRPPDRPGTLSAAHRLEHRGASGGSTRMTGVQPATGPRGMDAAQSEPWSADIKEKEKKKRQSQSCDCCRARKVACKEATPEEIEVALSKFAAGTSGLTDGRINLGTSTSGSPNSPSDSRDGVAALRPALSEAELLSVGGSSVPIKKDGSKRGVCKHCLTLSVKCTFDYKPRKRGPPNLYLKRLAEQQQSGSSNGHEVNAQAGPSGSQAQKSRKDSARAPRPSTSATNTTRQGGFHAPARPDASRSDSMSNPSPSQHPLYAGGLETLDGFTSFVRGEHAPGPLGTGTSPDDVSGAGGSGYGEQDYSADDNDAYPPGEHLDDRYRMDGNAFEESRGETNGNGRYGMSLRHDAGVIDPSLDQRKSLDLSKILSPPLINDSLDRSIFMQGNGTPSLNLPSILPQEYGRDHGGKTGTDSYMTLPYPQAHASSTATLGSLGHANDPQYPTGNTYHSASPLSSLINPPVQSSTHIGSQAQNPLDAILPRQLLLLIINLFFDYVFALTPCLHKPTFFRDLINRREEQPGQEEWTALVLSTVASTLVQVPRAYVPLTRKEVRELAARCHQECRNWSLHGYKEVTVSAVIIRYFDTVYNYCRGNIGTCHTSLCEAQALATVLRLHEEDTYTYLNPIEREIRRRIFFLLFGADKSEAILLGRPVRMREEDCYSLRLPEELDDDYVTEERYLAQPAGVTSLITGFNAITRIHCYVGRLMTKHREDKRDPPSGARLQRRLNELDKLHDQIMSVMDRCPSALRLKTGLDSRAQSPAGGWDVDAQAKLQEFFFDSKASREIAKDAYLVQQGNIYVTQQLARFCLLQYRSDLMVLHKKEQDIPASRLSAGASEGWTPSGGMALGGIGKSTASAPDPAADALASEKESLFYDLLSVLHSIPIQSIAVNGPSLVNNVRYVASALLDAVQTKSNKSFDSASVGVSASVLRAQGYLMDFLSILSDIERNYQLQDEGEV